MILLLARSCILRVNYQPFTASLRAFTPNTGLPRRHYEGDIFSFFFTGVARGIIGPLFTPRTRAIIKSVGLSRGCISFYIVTTRRRARAICLYARIE